MGFFLGYVLGFAVGIGLIVGFGRYQHTRSKRRADLVSKFKNAVLLNSMFDVIAQ